MFRNHLPINKSLKCIDDNCTTDLWCSCCWPALTTERLGQLEMQIVSVNSTVIYYPILTLLLDVILDFRGKNDGVHVELAMVPVSGNVSEHFCLVLEWWVSRAGRDRCEFQVSDIRIWHLQDGPLEGWCSLLHAFTSWGTRAFTKGYWEHSFDNWQVYYIPNTLRDTNGGCAFNIFKRKLVVSSSLVKTLYLTFNIVAGIANLIARESCTCSSCFGMVTGKKMSMVVKSIWKVEQTRKEQQSMIKCTFWLFIPVKKLYLIGSKSLIMQKSRCFMIVQCKYAFYLYRHTQRWVSFLRTQ